MTEKKWAGSVSAEDRPERESKACESFLILLPMSLLGKGLPRPPEHPAPHAASSRANPQDSTPTLLRLTGRPPGLPRGPLEVHQCTGCVVIHAGFACITGAGG